MYETEKGQGECKSTFDRSKGRKEVDDARQGQRVLPELLNVLMEMKRRPDGCNSKQQQSSK